MYNKYVQFAMDVWERGCSVAHISKSIIVANFYWIQVESDAWKYGWISLLFFGVDAWNFVFQLSLNASK